MIDAELLAQCQQVLGVRPAPALAPEVIGLRRALARRHKLIVDAHRAECRLWSLGSWAFPDLWRACGGHGLAQPVLGRWPELAALSRAQLSSIAEIVAARTRDRDPARRAERIRDGARGWLRFWRGRLDLDSLAWEVGEMLSDIEIADANHRAATAKAVALWRAHWPDDPLLSIPGVGEICASATRAWWDHGAHLPTAKAAGAFIGLNASNWESGVDRLAVAADHQGRAAGHAFGLLPSRQRGPPPRPPPGPPLPQARRRRAPHPHVGQLRHRPKAGLPHLGRPTQWAALSAARPGRKSHRLGHCYRHRQLAHRARRPTPPSLRGHRPETRAPLQLTIAPARATVGQQIESRGQAIRPSSARIDNRPDQRSHPPWATSP